MDLGEGARLEVLGANRSGAVLLLEEPGPMPVTALLLANSGSTDSNPPEWLPAWDPQLTLLSVGAGDRRARPAPEVLQAAKGYNLLRTDKNGWIEVTTDEKKMWVTVEKGR